MDNLICRFMRSGDEEAVSQLIQKSFHRFIAQDYKPEGLRTFLEDTSSKGIARILRKWPLMIVAEAGGDSGKVVIVGVIALRLANHISLFFVEESWHGKGVGTLLLKEAVRKTQEAHPDVHTLTVNSSPYAVDFYEKMGFKRRGPEQFMDGMLVNPMKLLLKV
jgi:GNAT superfamily N-acetyltransferase